jgi:hypothetical protein
VNDLVAAAGLALLYLARHLDEVQDEQCAVGAHGRPILDSAPPAEQERIHEVRTIIADLTDALQKAGYAS